MRFLLSGLIILLLTTQLTAEVYNFTVKGQKLRLETDALCQNYDDPLFIAYEKISRDTSNINNKGISEWVAFFWSCDTNLRYNDGDPNKGLSFGLAIEHINGYAPNLNQQVVNEGLKNALKNINPDEIAMGNDPDKTLAFLNENDMEIGATVEVTHPFYATLLTKLSVFNKDAYSIGMNRYLDPYLFKLETTFLDGKNTVETSRLIDHYIKVSEQIARSMTLD